MSEGFFATKEIIDRIAREYPTPFYLYDEKGIRENARELLRAFSWNEGFKEYFAVKATPNPAILGILKDEGCGVDCSSLTELMMARRCGFSGHDIMFSSNVTPRADFEEALRLGALINFDDISHIGFLAEIGDMPKTVCCRYNPGGTFSGANGVMGNPGDAKYGFTEAQIFEGFEMLKNRGVGSFGLHAFLASNTVDDSYYPALAKELFTLAVKIKQKTGIEVGFINLSGGVGVPYRERQKKADIFKISEGVKGYYDDILLRAGFSGVKIFTELGRYMLAPYGCLVATVLHEKKTYKDYIGLDACAANLMRPAMYGAYHRITIAGKENAPQTRVYDVTGGLCENNDKFAVDRTLPEISVGDRVIIHDAGAHGFSMGYNYNGKLRSAEILLREDGSYKLIRRAETPEDYFATLDI